jgi:hypothetical protein
MVVSARRISAGILARIWSAGVANGAHPQAMVTAHT